LSEEPVRLKYTTFEVDRWRASGTYRRLSPHERLIAAALWLYQGQFGPIRDEDAELSVAAMGIPPEEVRAILTRANFHLTNGDWVNATSIGVYNSALEVYRAKRDGGRKGGMKHTLEVSLKHTSKDSLKHTSKDSQVNSCDVVDVVEVMEVVSIRPSSEDTESKNPPSSSSVTSNCTDDAKQTSLALDRPRMIEGEIVHDVIVPAPAADRQLEHVSRQFLLARHLRRFGNESDAPAFKASRAMIVDVAKSAKERLSEGHSHFLLMALPALVDEDFFKTAYYRPNMLLGFTKSRESTHALNYAGRLPDLVLNARQCAVLKALGDDVVRYIQSQGARGVWQ
jgi:hypothetical protein